MAEPSNHYGPTAARARGRPGRETRPASATVDAHAHAAVPEAAAYAAPQLDPAANPMTRFATPDTRAPSRKEADRRRVMTGIEPRLRDMDEAGIDVQVVAPPPGQCYSTLRPGHAVPATRVVNDGMAAFAALRPDRLAGLGTVPMQEPAEAVRKLERCMGALGLQGVQILTNLAGRELSDPAFEPFWVRR